MKRALVELIVVAAPLSMSSWSAACGASTPAAPSPVMAEPAPYPEVYTTLPWGMTRSEVERMYEGAEDAGDDVRISEDFVAHKADVYFGFDDRGHLFRIRVDLAATYASMGECGEAWRMLRAEMNRTYGGSSSDNLAAYWSAADREVTLACNPADDGQGATLSASYVPADTTD